MPFFGSGSPSDLKAETETSSSTLACRAMSRHGFAHRLALHVTTAQQKLPSMTNKRVSPHTLRHSCAMHTLEATGDIRKVSLWLGHQTIQTTEMYLRADPVEKLDVLAAGLPPGIRKGSFKDAP